MSEVETLQLEKAHFPSWMLSGIENNLLGAFDTVFCNLNYQTETIERPFSATFCGVNAGALSIFKYEGRGFRRACRNPQNIRNNMTDIFIFALPLNAPMEVTQSGHRTVIQPGLGVFLTTSRPFDVICGEPAGLDYHELVIRIPGPLLRRYVPNMDECCARSIQMQHGAGKVMKSLVESLLSEGRSLSANQAERCGSALLDVIAGVTPDIMDYAALQEPLRLRAYARTRQQAARFIENNLSDPRLDVNLIAEHCHVSARYLHTSFEEASSTVGALIREMRLLRCRADLLNKALRHQPLTQIAMRWGFNSSSNFSRAYFTRFGKTPSRERSVILDS
jgi:AraC-like DNA-binding protein